MSFPAIGAWLAANATAIQVAGTAFSVVSSVVGGIQEKRRLDYESAIARNRAVAARQKASFDAAVERRNTERFLSTQVNRFGKSGVQIAGTPLEVLGETAAEGQLNVDSILYSGELQAMGYEDEARLRKFEGRQALVGGVVKAGKSLLTGASRVAVTQAKKKEIT